MIAFGCALSEYGKTVALKTFNPSLAVNILIDAIKSGIFLYLLLTLVALWMRWISKFTGQKELKETKASMHQLLHAGSNGEEKTQATLEKIINSGVFGDDSTIVRNSVVLKPVRRGGISQEIDHLLITKFGVFIIESKNYGGKLQITNSGILCGDGVVRKNPLDQCKSKIHRIKLHLELKLKKSIPVNAIAVFCAENSTGIESLGNGMVALNGIKSHLMAYKRDFDLGENLNLDVLKIYGALQEIIDQEPGAKHRHMLSINQSEYIDLEHRQNQLRNEQFPLLKFIFFNYANASYCAIVSLAVIFSGVFGSLT